MVSVILPVNNERENLAPLVTEIEVALARVPHEIVAVDDGSTDGSGTELDRIAAGLPVLRVVRLARHAGQSAALAAGLDRACGEILVTMDADGQNDPRDADRLVAALEQDPELDAVVGFRVVRVDSRWRRLQSRVANAVRNRLTGDSIRDTGCGLKAIRRAAAARVPRFDGMHRFLPTLIRADGGNVLEMPVTHRPRVSGRSHYGMYDRAVRGLVDAFAVRWWRRRALVYSVKEDAPQP